MVASVNIGSYYPVKSFIHNVDARLKILTVLLMSFCIFIFNSYIALVFLALFYFTVFIMSSLPINWMLKTLRPVTTVLFIAFFFQVLFTPGSDLLFQWGVFTVSIQGLVIAFTIIFKVIILVGFATILSFSTTPVQLTDAISYLMFPLRHLRFPVEEMSLVLTMALRFIPQILSESRDLVKAQKSRGVDFYNTNILLRAKSVISLFVPLFVAMYRNAEDAGKAMASRGYNSRVSRTKFRQMVLGAKDYFSFIALSAVILIAVILNKNFL